MQREQERERDKSRIWPIKDTKNAAHVYVRLRPEKSNSKVNMEQFVHWFDSPSLSLFFPILSYGPVTSQ